MIKALLLVFLVMSYNNYGAQHTHEEKNSQKISKIKQAPENPLEVKVHARQPRAEDVHPQKGSEQGLQLWDSRF